MTTDERDRVLLRPNFLISIDTEGDNLWSRPRVTTTRNAQFLPRFQALCEKYRFRPTYLATHEMGLCPAFQSFGRDVLRRGTAEIGTHVHAWDSPPLVPLTADDPAHHPYLFEYPPGVIDAKVARLTGLLEDTFGIKMVSHRAGRWGFDSVCARVLAARGYLVDCSVTPLISWQEHPGNPRGRGGPDYRTFPTRAYFLDLDDIRQPGSSPLLEIPLTVLPHPRPGGRFLHRLVRWAPRVLRAPVNRAFPPLVRLQPTGQNLRPLLCLLLRAREERRDYVQFTLHSSELMPGGSPLFPTARSIERLYEDMEAIFAEAFGHFRGATLAEYARQFRLRNASPAVEPASSGGQRTEERTERMAGVDRS